jgi:hypothetical protein
MLIPHWPWYGWVIAGLVMLLVLFMEGSYRVIRDLQNSLNRVTREMEKRQSG